MLLCSSSPGDDHFCQQTSPQYCVKCVASSTRSTSIQNHKTTRQLFLGSLRLTDRMTCRHIRAHTENSLEQDDFYVLAAGILGINCVVFSSLPRVTESLVNLLVARSNKRMTRTTLSAWSTNIFNIIAINTSSL